MTDENSEQDAFVFDAQVDSGEKRHFQYEIGETYLGQPVELPVTILNGEHSGPRLFLSAAVHGDEVNGVKVIQQIASRYDPADIHGTLVCLHVLNVPGYVAEQRYLPIYDKDLNRSFPGSDSGSTAARMAKEVYDQFVSQCDVGLDFHTSTRNRITLSHARADMDAEGIPQLVDAYGANIVVSGRGSEGMLRRVATEDGIPTATIEMGEANRFQPVLIEEAIRGVEGVMAEFDLLPDRGPRSTAFRKILSTDAEKRWIRADNGGLVEMKWGPYPVVEEGETICIITDHFVEEEHVVRAPTAGLLIGILANPRVLPGHPLVHLVELPDDELDVAKSVFEQVGFRGHGTFHWMGKTADTLAEDVLEDE